MYSSRVRGGTSSGRQQVPDRRVPLPVLAVAESELLVRIVNDQRMVDRVHRLLDPGVESGEWGGFGHAFWREARNGLPGSTPDLPLRH
jgi:hypothetical protein